MAGSSYNYDKSSKFFSVEEDDVDDSTFLKNSRAYESSTIHERHQQLMEERRKIEQRTVQSSMRSVGLLHETEEIGNATAQELTLQREQLENTEQKLDDINSSLRTSQKHIQGIKSVFGSIKNYFSGSKGDAAAKAKVAANSDNAGDQPDSKPKSELSRILESQNEQSPKRREQLGNRILDNNPTSKDIDEILDENLEEMKISLSRLKGLGMGLQKELDDQNILVDRITNKTEEADFRIEQQNKDMNRILKK